MLETEETEKLTESMRVVPNRSKTVTDLNDFQSHNVGILSFGWD